MKRFYKTVDVQPVAPESGAKGWQVMLDNRAIRTVKGSAQIVPHEHLAHELAREWRDQGEVIDAATLPMRDMVDYTIDVVAPQPSAVVDGLIAYADTDTLLYRANPEEALFKRQLEMWEPIVTAFEAREGVSFKRASGIMHVRQESAALARIRDLLGAFDPFVLTGVEAMTNLAASLITGLTAIRADADPLALWRAASLEEEWQAEQWGLDEEAEARRIKRESDFLKARQLVRVSLGEPTAE